MVEQLSVSATTPWPAKAASPWSSTGSTENASGSLMRSCLARTMPSTTGSTVSRWLGLAASSMGIVSPRAAGEGAGLAEVVLHVARALGGLGVDVALELLEELVVALAHDVGEHVEPAAVGHAHDRAVEAVVGGPLEHGVEDRDGRLGALDAEALLADVLGGEELLEGLGGVEPAEDVALLVGVERDRRRPRRAPGSSASAPARRCACTRCRWCGSRRCAARARMSPSFIRCVPADAAGEELAVEVPDGEAVGGGVELAVHVRLLPRQRVEVGDEVAAHPVLVDQRLHVHLLLEAGLLLVDRVVVGQPLARPRRARRGSGRPRRRSRPRP